MGVVSHSSEVSGIRRGSGSTGSLPPKLPVYIAEQEEEKEEEEEEEEKDPTLQLRWRAGLSDIEKIPIPEAYDSDAHRKLSEIFRF